MVMVMVAVPFFLNLLACNALAPLPGAVQEQPECNTYLRHPNVYGFCLYKHVDRLQDLEQMEQSCRLANSWEARCRHSWVNAYTSPSHGYATERVDRSLCWERRLRL